MAGGAYRRRGMQGARYISARTACNGQSAPSCGSLQERISQHDCLYFAGARRPSQRDECGWRLRRVACRSPSRSFGASGQGMMHRDVVTSIGGFAVLMALLASSNDASNTAPARVPATAINGLFAKFVSAHEPGCAVLVVKDGQPVFRKGYGVTDLRTLQKIGRETNFRLASLTKQFTAMAVMLLVHDGKLHCEDRLTDVFPDFPAHGKE